MDTANPITIISPKPKYGTEEYNAWIAQDDFIRFLQAIPTSGEIILYASLPFTFVHGVLAPTRLVTPPNVDDLDRWSYDPSDSWGISIGWGKQQKVSISPPMSDTGSKTLDRGEQIVFRRRFEGRQEQPSYFEVLQKITHTFDLHYVPERLAFCRFDELGDIEDVIKVKDDPGPPDSEGVRVVTMLRSALDKYMVITGQALVLMYDSTRFETGNVHRWGEHDRVRHECQPEIYYHMGQIPGNASYLRGFQIVRPTLSKKGGVQRYGFCDAKEREYATFLVHDWKHNRECECSCGPKRLGNYFVESEFPFEISPVFFRPEVLQKYKADSNKYEVLYRKIRCRQAWSLETYDVNEAGQVHTYLKYLSRLPYKEQLYWKSFNEAPKGPISRRAFQTDFQGEWDTEYDPLESLTEILHDLQKAQVPWWTLRDECLIERVHYPVTDSADEWAKEIHALDKLLIEGFVTRDLRLRATSLGRTPDSKWQSIKLIEEILHGLLSDGNKIKEIVEPLREVNFLRSKISGHASGKEAKQIEAQVLKQHKTYRAHFRQLCAQCDSAVRALQSLLSQRVVESGNTTAVSGG